jgi:hypothetical protein
MQFQAQDSEILSQMPCFEGIRVTAADTIAVKECSSSRYWVSVLGSRYMQKPATLEVGLTRRSVALADQRAFGLYNCMRECYSRSYQEHERLLKLQALSKIRKV